MDVMIHINEKKETLKCSICSAAIEPDDEYATPEEDEILCLKCFDSYYKECEFCGKREFEDNMKRWGDCRCCPDCFKGFCPPFTQDQNEKETDEAYKAMLQRYIGKKSINTGSSVELEETYYDDGQITYKMEVWFDDEGKVIDVSRLSATVLLYEGLKSSEWSDYIIRNEDYVDKVDDLMDYIDWDE